MTMAVLHLINASQRRGAENVAGYLQEALTDVGWQSSIRSRYAVVGDRRDDVTEVLGTHAVLDIPRQIWRLRRTLATERPDVVLAHGFLPALLAEIARSSRRKPRPRLVWQRILRLPKPPEHPTYLLHRWVARRCDAAVCITQYLLDETRRFGHRGTIALIPNHRPSGMYARETPAGPSPKGTYVLFAGRLVPQKRPDRFVRVAATIAHRNATCSFVIAGTGEMEDELRSAIAQEESLIDRVEVLGHVDDLRPLLRSAVCLALTSETESSPGVTVEAMMSGCRVVGFDVDGLPEILADSGGTIVDQDDESGFVDAVLAELEHPSDSARRDKLARQAARLSTEATIVDYLRVMSPSAKHLE